MKNFAIVAMLALVLVACSSEGEPVRADRGLNPVIVSEVEGCRLYRVKDGNYVYFTICDSHQPSTTAWEENCGKNCWRPVTVDTKSRQEDGN